MKKNISLAVLAGFLLVFVSSCTKYDDGPLLSFRPAKERVVNSWKVEYAFRNLSDVTEDFTKSYVTYFDNGSAEFRTYDELDSLHIQLGLWFLRDNNTSLEVIYTEPLVDPDRLEMKITRLNEKRLWVTYTLDDTSKFEIRYVPESE